MCRVSWFAVIIRSHELEKADYDCGVFSGKVGICHESVKVVTSHPYFMHSIGLLSPGRMVHKAGSVSSDGVKQLQENKHM
jgi:hypothetical protein